MQRNIPMTEQPKAKMLYYGVSALSNAELLSLVIKTGTQKKTALELANDTLLYVNDNFGDLGNAEVRELSGVYGIGDTKACSIVAAMELGKRMNAERALKKLERVTDPSQVAELLMDQYSDEKREHLLVLCLNTKCQIESQNVVSIGNLSGASVHPRDVFAPAIRRGAAAIIAAHNHPSGDPTQSTEDIHVTARLKDAGELLGIPLYDHVILGRGCYVSMRSEGYLD